MKAEELLERLKEKYAKLEMDVSELEKEIDKLWHNQEKAGYRYKLLTKLNDLYAQRSAMRTTVKKATNTYEELQNEQKKKKFIRSGEEEMVFNRREKQ